MKPAKKQKKVLPEVHILGDLQDVKTLISGLNKKKTIVLFHDGEQDSLYLEIEGKFQQIHHKDIRQLEKEYKLIYFSFFPSRKKIEPLPEEKTEVQEPETPVVQELEKKKKKEKEEKKGKKIKKEKKEPEAKREKK
jgi:hypothetical protein